MKYNELFILFWKYNETFTKIQRIEDLGASFLSFKIASFRKAIGNTVQWSMLSGPFTLKLQ